MTTQTQKKILIVGDGGVGKTCFIDKYFTGRFEKKYIPGVGIQEHVFTDELIVYDFPGQCRLGNNALRNTVGKVDLVVIMYDMTNSISFRNTKYWKRYITEQLGETPVVMVGNKADMSDKITVRTDNIGISVKSGSNLDSLFKYFGRQSFDHWDLVL